LNGLGSAYRWAKIYEDAIRSYKESIEIEPNIYSYVGLAASYSLLGRDKEAYEAALEVRKINPEFSLAEFNKVIPQINKSKQQIYINAFRKAGLSD